MKLLKEAKKLWLASSTSPSAQTQISACGDGIVLGGSPRNPKAGEKIFKTKCVQCHMAEKGAGHKQGERHPPPPRP